MPSQHDKIDSQKVIASLNAILELELAGVVRYLHYSLMVFGHARIPIIGWMRSQATECRAEHEPDAERRRVPQARHHPDPG